MNTIQYLTVFLVVAYAVIFVYKTKTGSPSVWSKDKHIKRMLKYVKNGMSVADMGCGDGRVLIEAVKQGAKEGEGWEIEPIVFVQAKWKVNKEKLNDRIKIHFADMWTADLSKYDLVYVYQLTRYAPRFVDKCKKEMKSGSIVIANTYPLKGLNLIKQDNEILVYMI